MGTERVVRRVSAATPDLAADVATEAVVQFEAAGFRIDDYTWPVRQARAPSTVGLAFVPARDGAVPPQEWHREPLRCDDPVRRPRLPEIASRRPG